MSTKKKGSVGGPSAELRELRRIRNLLMLALKNQGAKLDELSKVAGMDKGDISRAISTKKSGKSRAK